MPPPKPKRWIHSLVRHYGLRTYKLQARRSYYKKVAAFKLVSNKGPYFLKPFLGQKAHLDRVYSRIVRLKEQNFRHLPGWLKTKKGNHWVEQGGRLYYLSEWIEGAPLNGNEANYERLGEVLAQLHRLTRRTEPAASSLHRKEIWRFRKQHQLFVSRLPGLRQKKQGTGKWFKEHGHQCIVLAEEAWSTLRQPDVQRKLRRTSIIHGDVTQPNVLVSPDDIYLVDWEFCKRGSAYYEVAKTLNNVTYFSIPYMNAFLLGYERVCPLAPVERRIIAAFLRLPREIWIAARQLWFGRHAALFESLKQSWPLRMAMIQWLDAWAIQPPPEPAPEPTPESVPGLPPEPVPELVPESVPGLPPEPAPVLPLEPAPGIIPEPAVPSEPIGAEHAAAPIEPQ